jgi:hypothetical protein
VKEELLDIISWEAPHSVRGALPERYWWICLKHLRHLQTFVVPHLAKIIQTINELGYSRCELTDWVGPFLWQQSYSTFVGTTRQWSYPARFPKLLVVSLMGREILLAPFLREFGNTNFGEMSRKRTNANPRAAWDLF